MSDNVDFGERARVALWYAIEEAFGGEMHDPHTGDTFWSPQLAELEERLRKRLHRLKLGEGTNVPKLLQAFVVKTATTDQVTEIAEEAVATGLRMGLDAGQLQKLKASIELALKETGIDTRFDAEGRLVRVSGIDTSPRPIAELPNQAEFNSALASQAATPVAVVFVDLDNFKAVNDTRGHSAGNDCLATVAEVISGCIVGKGRLYRYGGDEFTVILQNAGIDEAAATAERIRRSIESARPGGEIEVTASVGVAASDQTGFDRPEKLLEAADKAMYQSKEGGKNRVTNWSTGDETTTSSRSTMVDRIKCLVDLAEFGVHSIQNAPQELGVDALAEKRRAWEADVLAALADARASQSEMSWFRVIGTYTRKGLPGRTSEHRKIVNEVAEKIDRLRRIIEQIEERSPHR